MQSGTKDERKSLETPNNLTGMALWLWRMHSEKLRGEHAPRMFRLALSSVKYGDRDERKN